MGTNLKKMYIMSAICGHKFEDINRGHKVKT